MNIYITVFGPWTPYDHFVFTIVANAKILLGWDEFNNFFFKDFNTHHCDVQQIIMPVMKMIMLTMA